MTSEHAEQLKRLRWTCRRTLNGHGAGTAAQLLAEIPTDLGMDRYGSGGAVEALEDEDRSVFTWSGTSPGTTPSVRVIELTVGDATLDFAADEVAEIIAALVDGERRGASP